VAADVAGNGQVRRGVDREELVCTRRATQRHVQGDGGLEGAGVYHHETAAELGGRAEGDRFAQSGDAQDVVGRGYGNRVESGLAPAGAQVVVTGQLLGAARVEDKVVQAGDRSGRGLVAEPVGRVAPQVIGPGAGPDECGGREAGFEVLHFRL